MSDDFKFDSWCTSRELLPETKKWLEENGYTSRSALSGLQKDDIEVGDNGVKNKGERSKIMGGVEVLKPPTGNI